MTAPVVACFISPHGFGHAARCSAAMEELHRLVPDLELEIFTRVPRWFFEDSLGAPFRYHPVETDIGFRQLTSLEEDLPATVEALESFLPFRPELLKDLAGELVERGCQMVVSDISPLGIAVARQAGLFSVLVENFTWDWMYRNHTGGEPRLEAFAGRLEEIYRQADRHIQATPFCAPVEGAVMVGPVSRRPRLDRREVRRRLGIEEGRPYVLITMGGVRWSFQDLSRLKQRSEIDFVLPGATDSPARDGNLILLPHRSGFHHPDLVVGADAVVGKLGYSTVAELCRERTPIAWVERPRFPESPVLVRFVEETLPCFGTAAEAFDRLDWVDGLPELMAAPRPDSPLEDGAIRIAELLTEWLAEPAGGPGG